MQLRCSAALREQIRFLDMQQAAITLPFPALQAAITKDLDRMNRTYRILRTV
jgi:hypothetical protein